MTQGLLKWIKHGDIQPSLKGSDHCPIYIDLHDEITLESGEVVKLHDAMGQTANIRNPPRIAAKYWDEFSHKQTKLSTFFRKKSEVDLAAAQSSPPPATPVPNRSDTSLAVLDDKHTGSPSKSASLLQSAKKRSLPGSWSNGSSASSSSSKKAKKDSSRRKKVPSLSAKPKSAASSSAAATSNSVEIIEIDSDADPVARDDQQQQSDEQLDADYRLACELAAAQEEPTEPSPTPPTPSSSQSKAAWSAMFAPIQAPNCTVHGEVTKKFTVNKAGPNKGKTFYVCSRYVSFSIDIDCCMLNDFALGRPVGPGYDKGKGERLREEVDHQYRCNFFKWASDVKREAAASRNPGAS